MLFPQIALDRRIRVVDEHVVVVHQLRVPRKGTIEVARLGEFGERVAALPSEDHRRVRRAEGGEEARQPLVTCGYRVRGEDYNERAAGFPDSHIKRMPKSEIVGSHAHNSAAMRGDDLASPID